MEERLKIKDLPSELLSEQQAARVLGTNAHAVGMLRRARLITPAYISTAGKGLREWAFYRLEDLDNFLARPLRELWPFLLVSTNRIKASYPHEQREHRNYPAHRNDSRKVIPTNTTMQRGAARG